MSWEAARAEAEMFDRAWAKVRRFRCRIVGCWRCAPYETDDGIGGKCTDCGRIHGWVTRAELRNYYDARRHADYHAGFGS